MRPARGPARPDLRRCCATWPTRRRAALDALPEDLGERIRALQGYDFLEPDARARFEALLERLRRQVLDAYFEGLSEQIRGISPETLAANREMVRDLNRCSRSGSRAASPTPPSSWPSMARFFPGAQDARRHHRAA